MTLTTDERKAIVAFKIEKAEKTFQEAQGILALEYWNTIVNRLYYASFYMTTALLISNGYEARSHSGVIHLLGLHFIKTNIISKENGQLYTRLYDLRQTGDYDDFYELTKDDVLYLMTPVENYLSDLKELIKE